MYGFELQQRELNRKLKGVLLGLKAEIKILFQVYNEEFGKAIENLNENEPFPHYYPITQHNQFVLYDGNSAYLGLIPDDDLRILIIKTYIKGRTIIETHLYNNQLLDKTDEARKLPPADSDGMRLLNIANQNLKEYGINIKNNYNEMKELFSSVMKRLDEQVKQLDKQYQSDGNKMLVNET
jgi:hypothetical protein